MLIESQEQSFKRFPYPANFDDGNTNTGGIALFLEPERIDEITEIQPFPALKDSILQLNTNSNGFVSLGLGLWVMPETDYSSGYIEIGHLNSEFTFSEEFMKLDEYFFEWLSTAGYSDSQIQYLSATVNVWEHLPTWILQNAQSRRIAVWMKAQNMDELALLMKIVVDYFCSRS